MDDCLRTRLAAMLEDAGHTNVKSLAGGIKRWMAMGYATATDTAPSESDRRRYARHIVMPSVETTGQQRLLYASVVIVGAGGPGSPVALYLAAAGIGTIDCLQPRGQGHYPPRAATR